MGDIDETDYWGELWTAVREQERLVLALKLLEGLRSIPQSERSKVLACMESVRELIDIQQRELHRRAGNYERDVQKRTNVCGISTIPTQRA